MPSVSLGTMGVFGWSWLAVLAVLALFSIRTRHGWIRVILTVMSWATLWFREFGVGATLRALVTRRHREGLNVEDFRDGAVAIMDYLEHSGPQLLFPALALGVVAVWGHRDHPALTEQQEATRGPLHVLGLVVGGLCLAWFVAALVTKSVGDASWTVLIWGAFVIALVLWDRLTEARRRPARDQG